MPLRAYQSEFVADIVDASRRSKRVLCQLPTGAGKTVVFGELIRRAREKNKDVLVLCHRRELVWQAESHISKHGINCGIIMAGEELASVAPVQIASIQTLHRRLNRLDMSRYGLCIYDEAHHAPSRTSEDIISSMPGAWVLGFTATPIRKTGDCLGSMFDLLVCGWSVKKLQAVNALCSTEYMSLRAPDLREVKTVGGDYSEKGLQEKAVPQLIGGVVDHYLAYGGKKGIIFSCGQKHSFYLRDDFARHGRKAIVIDSRTPEGERADLIEEFKGADTGILVNCSIFTEGFDLPDCDTLVLARPTKSLGLYLQMGGRGLRPAPSKTLLVIDHGANVYRHGFIEDDHEWSLEKPQDKINTQEEQAARIKAYAACPGCGTLLTGRVCHTCGREVTRLGFAKNVHELKNCGLKLIDKKDSRRPEKVSVGMSTADSWRNIVSFCALKGWKLGAAVKRYEARFGVLPWNAKLGITLPRGDDWKMQAKEWLEKCA